MLVERGGGAGECDSETGFSSRTSINGTHVARCCSVAGALVSR